MGIEHRSIKNTKSLNSCKSKASREASDTYRICKLGSSETEDEVSLPYYCSKFWNILGNNSIAFLNLTKTFYVMRIVLGFYVVKLTS